MVTPLSLRVTLVPHMVTAGLLTGYPMGPHTVTLAKPRYHPALPHDHADPPHGQHRIPPVGALWAEEEPGWAGPCPPAAPAGSEAGGSIEGPLESASDSRLVSAVGSASVS